MNNQEKSKQLKQIVKDKYTQIAVQSKEQNEASCCGASCGRTTVDYSVMSDDYTQLKGYMADADLGLGCERRIVGNPRRLPALGVLSPALWQIEAAVDQGVAFGTCVAQENADLTVLNPSGRPAVLSRNPDGMLALLQKSGLVQNQDA